MLDSLVRKMLRRGASPEEVIAKAMTLSREAYQKMSGLEAAIDKNFGSNDFRRNTIEPLLAKERQIDSIRARVKRGGKVRTSDADNLQSLLGRAALEYEYMTQDFPWDELELANRRLVSHYIEERRNHLQLGDVDRVRTTYQEALVEQPIAS